MVDAVGLSTGLAASSVRGRRVVGRLSVAPGPEPLRVSVRTPTGGKVTLWNMIPLSKSVWESHAVTPWSAVGREPQPALGVQGRVQQRQLQAARVEERLVEDGVVT